MNSDPADRDLLLCLRSLCRGGREGGGQNVYDIIKFISTKPFSPPQFTKPFNKKDWINALFI